MTTKTKESTDKDSDSYERSVSDNANNYSSAGDSGGSRSNDMSAMQQIAQLVSQGVPVAGGGLKPGKVGKGFGLKWSKTFSKGGNVKAKSASNRADGIAQRGKTRGRIM